MTDRFIRAGWVPSHGYWPDTEYRTRLRLSAIDAVSLDNGALVFAWYRGERYRVHPEDENAVIGEVER